MPRQVARLEHYEGKEPLFHKYKLESEIASIHSHKVPLKAGGSIVIDQTEALVAIDVNSGSFRAEDNAEETAFQLNIAAAKEIARQLRLRDLGGVIVNVFIDMRREKHRPGVERALLDALKRDRARSKILRTSPSGLIEMTRQRIRPSINRSVYATCPCCNGRGLVKTAESMAIEVVRMLMLAFQLPYIASITVRVNQEVYDFVSMAKSTVPHTCEQCEPLRQELEKLKTQVAALQAQLAKARKHSGNSSKPPSSDIVRPPQKNAGRPGRRPRRKRGGQPGHPRHLPHPFPPDVLDAILEYRYDACPCCGGKLEDAEKPSEGPTTRGVGAPSRGHRRALSDRPTLSPVRSGVLSSAGRCVAEGRTVWTAVDGLGRVSQG